MTDTSQLRYINDMIITVASDLQEFKRCMANSVGDLHVSIVGMAHTMNNHMETHEKIVKLSLEEDFAALEIIVHELRQKLDSHLAKHANPTCSSSDHSHCPQCPDPVENLTRLSQACEKHLPREKYNRETACPRTPE